jgi:hypothetical protein
MVARGHLLIGRFAQGPSATFTPGRFVIGHRRARRPAVQANVLHRLEGAAGEEGNAKPGAFLGKAEVEHLIKLGRWRISRISRKL